MRRGAVAVLAAAALLLAGCSEIPMHGEVQAGSTEGPNDTTIVYLPATPAPGASQRDIALGFLTAAAAGGDLHVAKEYLTTGFARKWDPRTRVLVQEAQPTVTATGSASLELQIPISAQVDEHGVYDAQSRTFPLDFQFEQQNGQWRISKTPDGVVLGETVFQKQYQPQALEFFDPAWKRLVPDVRWFPVSSTQSGAASRAEAVVRALIDGPAGPIGGGVTVNALDGARLSGLVKSETGVYTVALTTASEPTPAVVERMQQQLAPSLLLPASTALRLVVDGRVAEQAKPVTNQPGTLDAFVLTGGRFGTLGANGAFTETPNLGRRIAATKPSAVTISTRQGLAAVLDGNGHVAVVGTSGAARVVDTRSDLLAPTMDQNGWTYAIPIDDTGGLRAYHADRAPVSLPGSIKGDAVSAIEVSPDGTRMLVLVQNNSTGPEAYVAGIQRAADGTPTGLTTSRYPVDLGGSGGAGIDATWEDDGSVAVLTSSTDNTVDRVRVQQLGGVALSLGQLTYATSIVGTSAQRDLRVLIQSGAIWVWNNNLWQGESADQPDVDLIAVQR